MFLSVFDVFKIGIGPSSSHTMGPMTAARRFLDLILSDDWPRPTGAAVAALKVSLHGSLAYTGIGHGTGRAVIIGLMGEEPDSVDPDRMDDIVAAVEQSGRVTPPGHPAYHFRPGDDLVYDKKAPLPGHANGMRFSALDRDGRVLLTVVYYSIGGGFRSHRYRTAGDAGEQEGGAVCQRALSIRHGQADAGHGAQLRSDDRADEAGQ